MGFCRDCKYWEEYIKFEQEDDIPKDGKCRRYPPTAIYEYYAAREEGQAWPVVFPVVSESDWCGEFEAKTA